MAGEVNESDSGMELRDLLDDGEFYARRSHPPNVARQFDALLRLAHVSAEKPDSVLQELVDIAVEFCGADSAGISLEEKNADGEPKFRWVAIAGSFAQYLNGTTPRFFSPCGTCLSSGRAQLYRVTKPYYDFLGVVAEPITDGMLIPWTNEYMRGTIWAVAHHSREAFDLDAYRLLNGLADFVSIAIRHEYREKILSQKERESAVAAKASELAHRINNPLQILTNTIHLAQQGGPEVETYLEQASRELTSLAELVGKVLGFRTSMPPDEGASSIQPVPAGPC